MNYIQSCLGFQEIVVHIPCHLRTFAWRCCGLHMGCITELWPIPSITQPFLSFSSPSISINHSYNVARHFSKGLSSFHCAEGKLNPTQKEWVCENLSSSSSSTSKSPAATELKDACLPASSQAVRTSDSRDNSPRSLFPRVRRTWLDQTQEGPPHPAPCDTQWPTRCYTN